MGILLNASFVQAQSTPTPSPSATVTSPAPTVPIPPTPPAPTITPVAVPAPQTATTTEDVPGVDAKLSAALEKGEAAIANATAGAVDKARKLQQGSEKDLEDAQTLSAKNLQSAKKVALAKVTIKARSKLVDEISDAICGAGGKRPGCFFYGVIVASGSLTTVSTGAQHGGVTAHTITAAAIPTLGYRLMLGHQGRFSADFGLLSMIVSKDLVAAIDRKGCNASNAAFEKLLPCAGNATTTPILGAFAGITAGTSDVGIVSLMLTGGLARTTLDDSVHGYAGLTIGLVNFAKFLNY